MRPSLSFLFLFLSCCGTSRTASQLPRKVLEGELSLRLYAYSTTGANKASRYYDFRVQALDFILLNISPHRKEGDRFSSFAWERLNNLVESLQAVRVKKGFPKLIIDYKMQRNRWKVSSPQNSWYRRFFDEIKSYEGCSTPLHRVYVFRCLAEEALPAWTPNSVLFRYNWG